MKVEGIRNVYDRVMNDKPLDNRPQPDCRFFRRDDVEILAPNGKVIHTSIETENSIIEMMEGTPSTINSEEIPEAYSDIMGHTIVEIAHPFYNGNGRTGRFFLALYLSRSLSILTTLSLSRMLAENRGAYYRSFREVGHPLNHGELTSFVIQMLEHIAVAQDELDDELSDKQTLHQDATESLETYRLVHDLSKNLYSSL